MKRKIFAYLMTLTMIFTIYSTNYCYAAGETDVLKAVLVDGAALGAGALSGGLALLAVLGAGVLTSDGGQKAVVDMYNYCDTVNKQAIADMHGDYAVISNHLYDQAQSFVDSAYKVGAKLKRAIDFGIGADGTVTKVTTGTKDNPLLITCDGMTGSCYIDGLIVYTKCTEYGVSKTYMKDLSYAKSRTPFTLVFRESINDISDIYKVRDITYRTVSIITNFDILDKASVQFTGAQVISYKEVQVFDNTLPVFDNTVLPSDLSYYDYTRSGVAIPLPQTKAGDKVIAIPQAIPYTGGIGLTGDMCIPDALTIADADALTENPPTDPPEESNKIDWRPLKTSGVLFTTKFPFSLPWDLLKTFKALLIDDPPPPIWNLKWHDEVLNKDFGFKLDLSKFSTIFKIAKVFVLMSLIVGLIMATRKLLGGAT